MGIYGRVEHSILFEGVTIGDGAVIKDSIILPGAAVKPGAVVNKSIIGSDAVIGEEATIGSTADNANKSFYNTKICSDDITLIGPGIEIGDKIEIGVCSMVTENV